MKTLQQYLNQVTTQLNVSPPFPTTAGFYGARCVSISGSKSECVNLINELIKLVTNEVINEIEYIHQLNTMQKDLKQAIDNVLDFTQDVRGNEVIMSWDDQEWKDDSQIESEE